MSLSVAMALFGNKGEGFVGSLESDKDFSVGLYANGVFERRRTVVGDFVQILHKHELGYLKEECKPYFTLRLPKIPFSIYEAILTLFQNISKTIKSEVIAQVFWDKTKLEYWVYVPVQRVAGASIGFDRNAGPMIDANQVWVMDIHSHVEMGAFFSGVDTMDEKSTRLFGVIGKVSGKTEACWRAGCNQQFINLAFDDIFDMDSKFKYSYDPEWLKNISEYKNTFTPGYSTGYKPGTKVQNPKRDYSSNVKATNFGGVRSKNYLDYLNRINSRSYIDGFYSDDDNVDPVGNVQSDMFLDGMLTAGNQKYYGAISDFMDAFKKWSSETMNCESDNMSDAQLIEAFYDMLDKCDGSMTDAAKSTIYALSGCLNNAEWNSWKAEIDKVS